MDAKETLLVDSAYENLLKGDKTKALERLKVVLGIETEQEDTKYE